MESKGNPGFFDRGKKLLLGRPAGENGPSGPWQSGVREHIPTVLLAYVTLAAAGKLLPGAGVVVVK